MEHSDHNPKHGGTFFMSSDLFHHVEGVLKEGEFRFYVYDNFTQPIAGRYEATLTAGNGKESIAMALAADRTSLSAPIEKSTGPLSLAVRVKLDPQSEPQLYQFKFDQRY